MPRQFTDSRSQRIQSLDETVFTTFTRLALEHKAINLGQGFPDFNPPSFAIDAFQGAATGPHQYSPVPGEVALNDELALMYGDLLGRQLDPIRNVQVTVGATEALFAITQALINPGDEVIVIEPFYDVYPADVIMAGGKPIYVPLQPATDGEWYLDLTKLRKACNNRTRLLILNSPHNPTGKIFSGEEIDAIVEMADHFDFNIVTDQVYEHIAYKPHMNVATRPGSWERTLSISSLGKTFSVTGWKIGWAIGPEWMIQALRLAHQWIPFTVATPLQIAASEMIRYATKNNYFSELRSFYLAKRDRFIKGLQQTPFQPLVPDGSYFVMANISELKHGNSLRVCHEMPERIGVGAIPASAFYSKAHTQLGDAFVRFAFCKNDTILDEALLRLNSFLA